MLFKFGTFWKLVLGTTLSWIAWALVGFEFTIITLTAIIIVLLTNDKHYLV